VAGLAGGVFGAGLAAGKGTRLGGEGLGVDLASALVGYGSVAAQVDLLRVSPMLVSFQDELTFWPWEGVGWLGDMVMVFEDIRRVKWLGIYRLIQTARQRSFISKQRA
jgi:hypothetical protein